MLRRGSHFPGKDYLEHILARWCDAGGRAENFGGLQMSEKTNLNGLVHSSTRRELIAGAGIAFGGLALSSTGGWAEAVEEISHAAESIHQEPVFMASRKRVYEALTDAKQFDKVVQ